MDTKATGELISRLVEYLAGRSEVMAVYLYGSQAEGRVGTLSDIDIAVLIRDGLAEERLWRLEDALAADLRRILHTDRVDLIVLNLAPLRVRYEVIIRGQYCIRLTTERAPILNPTHCVATGISRSTWKNTIACKG